MVIRPDKQTLELDTLSSLFVEGLTSFFRENERPICDVEYAIRKANVSVADIIKVAYTKAKSNSTRHLEVAAYLQSLVDKYAK